MKSSPTVRVCVPLCAPNLTALEEMARQAARTGDFVELRLDCLSGEQLSRFSTLGQGLLNDLTPSVILTLRDPKQGGQNSWTTADRRAFWNEQLGRTEAWCDLEFDLVREVSSEQTISVDWSHVICSHHDFECVPTNLESIFEILAASPAKVLKIAVAARDVVDCLPIFRLLERAQRENRELIAIAMGDAGIATRILGPSRGSYLTYGANEANATTAPGQLTARDLKSVYRIDAIDEATVITGLVGLPAMHSVSPHMHNAALATERINGVYIPFQVSDASAFFTRMVHPSTRELDWRLRGLSITAPYKSTVLKFLDWIEPQAEEIGAVNTVVVERDKLLGYNTDADGFLKPLVEKLKTLTNSRIAVVGAGGAANAAVWSLVRSGAAVTIYARNQLKARALADRFKVDHRELGGATFAGYDAVVNTTPLGTVGALISETPAMAAQLEGARLVYDLIYNPLETQLLREARKAGCEILGGLGMLVHQALSQFELWTGKVISYSIMNDAALAQLTPINHSYTESQTQ